MHQKTRDAIIYAISSSKLRDPPLLDELAHENRLRKELRRAEENQQKANGLQQKIEN